MDEKEKLFNEVVDKTLVNLYSFTKNSDKIVVSNLSFTNKTDNFFFYNCLVASSLYGKEVYVKMPIVKFLYYKVKYKRPFKNTHLANPFLKVNVNIEKIAKFMSVLFEGTPYDFGDVYDEFYGG